MKSANRIMGLFCAWLAGVRLRRADAHVRAYEAWMRHAKEFEARS